jgi:peroxiredoxin
MNDENRANPYALPPGLPEPADDGACDHLAGRVVPAVELPSSEGGRWNLAHIARGRAVVFVYPATGVPGTDPWPGWDAIPGAPGCTVQALGFRRLYPQLRRLGYQVFGISGQCTAEQAEFRQRAGLPYLLLADEQFQLRDQLGLPTFDAGGKTFYRRLVLVLAEGRVRQVFYPVFPPDRSANEVLGWLAEREVSRD